MANGEDNAAVLCAECDSAIADIKNTPGMKTCDAHQAISRGLVVLLRCQIAQLVRQTESNRIAAAERRARWTRLEKYGIRVLAGVTFLAIGLFVGRPDLLDRLKALLP